jgi:hypothetical protein
MKEGRMWDIDDVTNNVTEWTATNIATESSGSSVRLSGRQSPTL